MPMRISRDQIREDIKYAGKEGRTADRDMYQRVLDFLETTCRASHDESTQLPDPPPSVRVGLQQGLNRHSLRCVVIRIVEVGAAPSEPPIENFLGSPFRMAKYLAHNSIVCRSGDLLVILVAPRNRAQINLHMTPIVAGPGNSSISPGPYLTRRQPDHHIGRWKHRMCGRLE